MRIGELDQRIELRDLVRSDDSQGGFTETWPTATGTAWAKVKQDTSFERQQGMVTEHAKRYTVTIRARTDITITTRWRIIWGARTLKILGITDPDGDSRWSAIECEEDDSP